MASGDQRSFLAQLQAQMPRRWFGDTAPVLTSILTGISQAFADLYSLLSYFKSQSRLKLATGAWLDAAAFDYLGLRVSRSDGETDTAFRARVLREILRPRVTRDALIRELTDLTGNPPAIFEPRNAADTGGYNTPTLGYGIRGGYGSANLPFQFFVTAYRPLLPVLHHTPGYGAGGGYGSPPLRYIGIDDIGGVSDSQLFDAINSVKPAATIAWVSVDNAPLVIDIPAPPAQIDPSQVQHLDVDFTVDESESQ